jgi:hypothetical protein
MTKFVACLLGKFKEIVVLCHEKQAASVGDGILMATHDGTFDVRACNDASCRQSKAGNGAA